ncbi:hypothetical protein ACLOJK_030029, partial [Asimina triloba]
GKVRESKSKGRAGVGMVIVSWNCPRGCIYRFEKEVARINAARICVTCFAWWLNSLGGYFGCADMLSAACADMLSTGYADIGGSAGCADNPGLSAGSHMLDLDDPSLPSCLDDHGYGFCVKVLMVLGPVILIQHSTVVNKHHHLIPELSVPAPRR